jgi:hypothetical protein
MESSSAVAGQLADYDSKRVTSEQAMNEALGQYGVPELRKSVADWRTTTANTRNALNAVDPSVTGRTSQSLVTEAQRQRMVASEREPIAGQLNEQTIASGQDEAALRDALGMATTTATNKVNDWNTGRQSLVDRRDTAYKREQDDMARQLASEQERRRQMESDRAYALDAQKTNYATSDGGKQVDPAAELLTHIQNQFKAAGGQGNKAITRQQQDAWVEAWLNQNGVSKANRQGYWDLVNKTYNRSADATKDWRYAR